MKGKKIDRVMRAYIRRSLDVKSYYTNSNIIIRGVPLSPKERERKLNLAIKEVSIMKAKLELAGIDAKALILNL